MDKEASEKTEQAERLEREARALDEQAAGERGQTGRMVIQMRERIQYQHLTSIVTSNTGFQFLIYIPQYLFILPIPCQM